MVASTQRRCHVRDHLSRELVVRQSRDWCFTGSCLRRRDATTQMTRNLVQKSSNRTNRYTTARLTDSRMADERSCVRFMMQKRTLPEPPEVVDSKRLLLEAGRAGAARREHLLTTSTRWENRRGLTAAEHQVKGFHAQREQSFVHGMSAKASNQDQNLERKAQSKHVTAFKAKMTQQHTHRLPTIFAASARHMWTIEEEGPCFFACFETSQRSMRGQIVCATIPRKQRALRPHFRLITILSPRGTKASRRKRICRPSAPFIQPLPTAELACNARIRSNDFLIASISTCSIGVCVTSGREST